MIYLKRLIKEIQSNQEIIVFLDMDGVLTDYWQALNALDPTETGDYQNDEYELMKLAADAGPYVWAEMEWMPDGEELWDFVSQHFTNIHILSSVDGMGNFPEVASEGKRIWCKHHLPGVKEENMHFVHGGAEKAKFAGPGRILIDDNRSNIGWWTHSKGIGILHRSAEKSIQELQSLFPNTEK